MIETATREKFLPPPFPWFGGKRLVAHKVWPRFGKLNFYFEPFFGSGAMLFRRPAEFMGGTETVNDLDGFVCNFWRAVQRDPDGVAKWCSLPPMENEFHARNIYLKNRQGELSRMLEADDEYFDVRIAGYWVYGVCLNIGSSYLGDGPWVNVEGKLLPANGKSGISRQMPHVGDHGRGINRQLLNIGAHGCGVESLNMRGKVDEYIRAIQKRLRHVRVCCGDWKRICNSNWMNALDGAVGVFLDPPYGANADRHDVLYTCESLSVAREVHEWCMKWGYGDKIKVALCGYEGEYDLPGWDCLEWKNNGGFSSGGNGRGKANRHRERIWFNPACLKTDVENIFDMAVAR